MIQANTPEPGNSLYRKLNRAKFAVLPELERDLPVPPFARE